MTTANTAAPKMGRPSKLNPRFLEAMNAVLAKEDFVLALTDAELLFYINYGLEPEERVSLRTFQRYKSYYNSWSELRAQEGTMVVEEVFAAFMKAMIELKVKMCGQLRDVEKKLEWRRLAWLLERKFQNWYLPKKVRSHWNLIEEPEMPNA